MELSASQDVLSIELMSSSIASGSPARSFSGKKQRPEALFALAFRDKTQAFLSRAMTTVFAPHRKPPLIEVRLVPIGDTVLPVSLRQG
jgi:hypothetical protein